MIKPLGEYVLLEKAPSEKKVGALVLATEKKEGNRGTVVAIGEGRYNEKENIIVPIKNLKVGDQVIYRDYSGTDYEEDEKKYLLIKAEDILAVIE